MKVRCEFTDISSNLNETEHYISLSIWAGDKEPDNAMLKVAWRLQDKGLSVSCKAGPRVECDWPKHPEFRWIWIYTFTCKEDPSFLYNVDRWYMTDV